MKDLKTYEEFTNEPVNEGKGYDEARKLINNLRAKVYRKLNDDELEEFKKEIADHIGAKLYESIINEETDSQKSSALARVIGESMAYIDPDMSYKVFADAVSKVIIEDYGSHNYKPFLNELKKLLK